jgi:tyrosyl-tRNA synthetase
MNPIEELQWRGLVHDLMPGTEAQLAKESTTVYIGFDPTADSLHVGSLVPIIILLHLQKFGHKPIALVGGATGMIGDPSGKSKERNLLNAEILEKNVAGIKKTLERFLDFETKEPNAAMLVNNYDWIKKLSFIDFIRDVGKKISVNYMMAKDSVKKRLQSDTEGGMSFTEFTYQLIQGYDFYHLYKNHQCKLQMGGSDQWGNITTGSELIRKLTPGKDSKVFAATFPLITKSDGTKFGKTESGSIWLDEDKTSAYKFYQFWMNAADDDAEKYIKIYTFLSREVIQNLIETHRAAPHERMLQKTLAEDVTTFVHGKEALEKAQLASNILFGKSTSEDLKKLDQQTLLEVFEGVPLHEITSEDLNNGMDIIAALSGKTSFINSNAAARRALKENSISVNKVKVGEEFNITNKDLIAEKYILLQKGKKNFFLLKLV